MLFTDHGTWSTRHVRSWAGSREKIAVAVIRNNSLPTNNRNHLANWTHVLVRNCVSVLAVTTPTVSSRVAIAHRMIHDTNADLPTPWPDVVAI